MWHMDFDSGSRHCLQIELHRVFTAFHRNIYIINSNMVLVYTIIRKAAERRRLKTDK